MDWIRLHPYAATFAATGVLVIGGSLIVGNKIAVTPSDDPRVWGGTEASLLNPSLYGPSQVPEAGFQFDPATNTPFYIYTSSQSGATTNQPFDFEALIAELSSGPNSTTTVKTGGDLSFAYSLIPSGLISTSTPIQARSEVQLALYNYGNEAGSYIQAYDDQYRNGPQTLKNQAEDRRDRQKAEAVRNLGQAIAHVGRSLEQMEDVPAAAQAAHAALAKSYLEVGSKLALVPDAESDQAFISAVTEYNASVEAFTRKYVALALMFSSYGVTFASHESGSVFTFTNRQ